MSECRCGGTCPECRAKREAKLQVVFAAHAWSELPADLRRVVDDHLLTIWRSYTGDGEDEIRREADNAAEKARTLLAAAAHWAAVMNRETP